MKATIRKSFSFNARPPTAPRLDAHAELALKDAITDLTSEVMVARALVNQEGGREGFSDGIHYAAHSTLGNLVLAFGRTLRPNWLERLEDRLDVRTMTAKMAEPWMCTTYRLSFADLLDTICTPTSGEA